MPSADGNLAETIAIDADDLHHCPANGHERRDTAGDDGEKIPNPRLPVDPAC